MIRRPYRSLVPLVFLSLALSPVACDNDSNPEQPGVRAQLYTTPTGLVTANPPQVFVGAGDITSCSTNNDEKTAELLDNIPGTVYVLGDDAYDNGTTSEFNNCYGPTWGRAKSRTFPSPGNHEYNSSGAAPYFAYFGAAAGKPGQGWYSFNLGSWHIISLNSNISLNTGGSQDVWLKADLAAHPNQCILAYYHHPLYSSGSTSGGMVYSSSRMFVNDLYAAHADLILNGHRHFYERLAPMNPSGGYDSLKGVREIIAGTGGIGGGDESGLFPLHEAGNGSTFGVLKLWLYDDSYAWKFVPIVGQTYTDSGTTPCHSAGSGGGTSGVSASNSTVSASPTSFTAGSGSSTITVTAKDGSGNLISGASVTLASTGSGNTLTPASGTTNSSGVFTSTLTSTVAEGKTVSATINGTAITQTAAVTVNPAVSAALSTVAASPTSFIAGSGSSTISVTAKDGSGNGISGASVTITATGSGNTLTPASGTTNSSGVLTSTLTSTVAEGKTVSATINGTAITQTAAVTVTPASSVSASLSTVAASPASFAAGGSSTITVTVVDGSGQPLSGIAVTLSATGSGNTFTQPAATDANGVTTGTFTSTAAGSHTVTAIAGGVSLTQKPVVSVSAGPPDAAQSTVTASPSAISTGSGTATITVTLKDAFGNPVSGSTVVLATSGTNYTLSQPSGPTDANGVTTGTLSSTDAQTLTVSAIAGGTPINQTASVTVSSGSTITQTLLTGGHDPTNTQTFTTASIAPAPNTLVTVAVLTHQGSAAAPSPTLTGGGMTSWDVVASVAYDGSTPLDRLTIFRAMSAAPGSGPITIKSSVTVSNCQWIVSQWSGVDQSGTNGSGAIVQTASASGDAVTSLTVALAAFASVNDVAYGAFGVANGTTAVITAGAGFTTIDQEPSGESSVGDLLAEWELDQPQVSATWPSKNAGALGVEIKAGP